MGFAEAVQTVLSKYAVFNGRASRPEYWWFVLAQAIVVLILDILVASTGSGAIQAILVIVWLALVLPSLAVGCRRLHDTDKTGWWLLIGLIPIVGTIVLIVFFVQPGTLGDNRYGPAPVR
jgi:uncharacterized membrane protein YhaH (DUF805 family)